MPVRETPVSILRVYVTTYHKKRRKQKCTEIMETEIF